MVMLAANVSAQNPSNSVSFVGGVNIGGGCEFALEAENYFRSNHGFSVYGMLDYHYAQEELWEYNIDCKKALGEVGMKKYFPVVEGRFYPFAGLGVTAGIQDMRQTCPSGADASDIVAVNPDKAFIWGGVGTLGFEYMFTRAVSFELLGRFKYEFRGFQSMHYVIAAGVKYSF